MKATNPKPMNRSEGCAHELEHLPSRVRCTFRATAMIGMTPSTVATALDTGIQAGTGALGGNAAPAPEEDQHPEGQQRRDSGCAGPGW